MLANPNISKIMPKAGNRYESALAIAKRARNIENRRLMEGDRDIHDAVDVASQEIVDGKVKVLINGEYVDKSANANVISDDVKDIVEE
ncbi:MAG: DNA-directed RNA polymerase subunit omega [Clostridia bacterium]|nr:DNA-directed RNA polymerase subunit omega [Clostridia bacterium]